MNGERVENEKRRSYKNGEKVIWDFENLKVVLWAVAIHLLESF